MSLSTHHIPKLTPQKVAVVKISIHSPLNIHIPTPNNQHHTPSHTTITVLVFTLVTYSQHNIEHKNIHANGIVVRDIGL